MKSRAGSVLNERYELLSQIGEGGFAVVFRAFDRELDRQVALKLIKDAGLAERDMIRFRREARLLAQLVHPNIVTVYAFEYIESQRQAFIVMEYLEGQNLRAHLNTAGRLDSMQTRLILRQLCLGLTFAHNFGVIHRDLSPANVFLLADNDKLVVKIIDFGLFRLFGGDFQVTRTLTEAGVMVGNPVYMSPELIKGDQEIDVRSDIYALGCILYECLCGRQAFSADTAMGLLYLQENEYPVEPYLTDDESEELLLLKDITLKCLQKNPEKRFQNCLEILELIDGSGDRRRVFSGMDQWRGSPNKGGSKLPKFSLKLIGVFGVLTMTGLVLANDAALCFFIDTVIAPISLARTKTDIASVLLNCHRYKPARLLYLQAGKYYTEKGELMNACLCRLSEAECSFEQRDAGSFLKTMEQALDGVGKISSSDEKAILLSRVRTLLERSSKNFLPLRSLLLLQTASLELMMECTSVRSSECRAYLNRILGSESLSSVLDRQVVAALVSVLSKYLYSPAVGKLDGIVLRNIEKVCNSDYFVLTQPLWKARIHAAKQTDEEEESLMLSYASRLLFGEQEDEALKLTAAAIKNSDKSPRRAAQALMYESTVYNKRRDYARALEKCRQAMELVKAVPLVNSNVFGLSSINKLDLLPLEIEALYHLNRQNELARDSREMVSLSWYVISEEMEPESVFKSGSESAIISLFRALARSKQNSLLVEQEQRLLDLIKLKRLILSKETEKTLLDWQKQESLPGDASELLQQIVEESRKNNCFERR